MEANNSWLKKAIAQGFMMLAALNLKGRPASADLTAVAELWLGILSGRSWQPEHDGIRIQAALGLSRHPRQSGQTLPTLSNTCRRPKSGWCRNWKRSTVRPNTARRRPPNSNRHSACWKAPLAWTGIGYTGHATGRWMSVKGLMPKGRKVNKKWKMEFGRVIRAYQT